MKRLLYLSYTLGICLLTVITSCNSNKKETKKLDTIYEHTDRDGHPLDNQDTIIEYKETQAKGDTSLPADKH